MQTIIWDNNDLDEYILNLLKKNTTIENTFGPNTVLKKIKEDNINVRIGILRIKDSLNRLSDKIKKTSGTHPKYYFDKYDTN